MIPEEFEALYSACGEAFEDYVQESRKMWVMLGECRSEALSLSERSGIHAQRLREHDVHARYQDLRLRLFSAAQIGFKDLK